MFLRIFTLLFFFLFSFIGVEAQRLIGKVYNERNEPAAGVSIRVTSGGGTTSNTDGGYSLNLSAGTYELTFSAVGYETKVVSDVVVSADVVNELNIVLVVQAKVEEGVVITTRTSSRKETVNSLLQFQKNSNTVASVISAETIRRSPDRNTGEVLKRTAGASIQEGRFIVVRGLADRYNQAMLNGVLLTSTEPDRKTFSFDLIPAQMIDNIIINKAFLPEFPGEWAGGLIQVNTRDVPSRNFFNIQLGLGFNTQTVGNDFYKDLGGNQDWLGIDDGTRSLPSGYKTKSQFDLLSPSEKTAIGKNLRNSWSPILSSAPLNVSFQANGGFATKLFGKTLGGTFGLTYGKSNSRQVLLNRQNSLDSAGIFSMLSNFNDERYSQNVTLGALGSLTLQLNPRNRISIKAVGNLNSFNWVTKRMGPDINRLEDVTGSEFTFKQNTFFSSQVIGEHTIVTPLRLKWYGSFNILDAYSPDQRRILYTKELNSNDPYRLLISNSLSQQSGSRIFQDLSDYIYTAGGDLTFNFNLFDRRQSLKGGYMLQIKDRLYDAKLFANYLPQDNPSLRLLPADKVFAIENFGSGTDNRFAFDAIKGNTFRYMANTILNSGYLQMDNLLTSQLRIVWGARVEHYDQLIGSIKTYDPRHTYSKVLDILPGVNINYALNPKTNIRLSGSQTVIRPELRELSALNLYDFELNASVQGRPTLRRTKVTNLDLRYELYPRAGEVLSAAVFYKKFTDPIEQYFNEGVGGSSTFTFINPERATAYGAELELRKKLDFITAAFQNFTFSSNLAYIYSRVVDAGIDLDRPLQGQSPYTVNLGLYYDNEALDFTSTILYNVVGERIYLVGSISAGASSPNIYEAPRPLLDFQVSKRLFKDKFEVKLNISDILNRTLYFYQNGDAETTFQKNKDAFRFTRLSGTNFNLSFNYTF